MFWNINWNWIVLFIVLCRLEGVLSAFASKVTFLTALTPAVATECGKSNLTWFGGNPPYAISLLANGTNGYSGLGFSNINKTSFVTQIPFPAGQWLEMLVRDSNGAEAFSSSFQVQAAKGSTDACLLSATPVAQANSNVGSNTTLRITSPSQTDSISTCDDSFTVNWEGGQRPYNLLLQTANRSVITEQAFGGPMMNGGSVNTRIQFPAGSAFQVIVTDAAGSVASTGIIKLASGGNQKCVISSDANSAANGASFVVSGSADASAIVLPTPTPIQHTLLESQTHSSSSSSSSSSASPSISASAQPNGNLSSSSKKTVAIIASVVSVSFVMLLATAFVVGRALRRRRRHRGGVDILPPSRRSLTPALIPTGDLEKYRPEPFHLPAFPSRERERSTSSVPSYSPPPPGLGYSPQVPVREVSGSLIMANPDRAETRPLPPVPYYPREKQGYGSTEHEHELEEPLTPITIVGPASWEDEKSMLR